MIDGLKVLSGLRSNAVEALEDVAKQNPTHVIVVFSVDGTDYDCAISNNLTKFEIIGALTSTSIATARQDVE